MRFDRYRVYTPEQELAAGRFVPTPLSFAAVDKIVGFNHIVPRLGATYDLTGDGKTVLKANWGRFYFNPGSALADAVNPNTGSQYADYSWNDFNNDRVYQVGEEGVLQTRFDGWQQNNANRPLGAYHIPTTVADPGPDGVYGNGDDGAAIAAFNLNHTTLPSNNIATNVDGYEGTFKTLEFSANKRYSSRWSMNASYSYTWTAQYGNLYFNNRFGTAVANFSLFGSYPTNPNEKTFNDYTDWNAKVSGTVDAGWGLRVTPVVKMQSGAPYGRYFVTRAGELNYGTQIILAEPIGTRRQDTVTIVDFRVEKQVRFAQKARLGLFFDLFNAMNSNVNVNENWRSGAAFEKATTVLGPRIAKFGVKFDW